MIWAVMLETGYFSTFKKIFYVDGDFGHFYSELSLQQGLHCSKCIFCVLHGHQINSSFYPCCAHAHGV